MVFLKINKHSIIKGFFSWAYLSMCVCGGGGGYLRGEGLIRGLNFASRERGGAYLRSITVFNLPSRSP